MPTVIALVEDLLFLSRIREAARGAGVDVRPVRTAAALLEAAQAGAALVLVDADSDRLRAGEAIAALRAAPGALPVPVIAFFSHVHAGRAEAARAAGASRVLARSAFVQELPGLLASAASTLPEEKAP
jgi:CheY-like chemotaxis protein